MITSDRTPQEVLTACQSVRSKADAILLDMGNILAEAKHRKAFLFQGHDSFAEYVETAMHLSKKSANRLIRLHRFYVEDMDIAEADLLEIGLDKLALILPLVEKAPQEFVEQMLEIARDTSYPELQKLIKEMKDSKKKPDPKKEVIQNFKEKMVLFTNSTWNEALFLLAITILGYDEETMNRLRDEMLGAMKGYVLQETANLEVGVPTANLEVGVPTANLEVGVPSEASKPQNDITPKRKRWNLIKE